MPLNDDANAALAVLIDADNASPAIIEGLLREVTKFGVATIKRVYGDWTTPRLGGWKEVLFEHSIQPIQQFANTKGKNATDSALIIDAMDLLYAGRLDGFCIVSSDSDFTRLAARLRESGRRVYGFGEQKTPRSFVSACDRFIHTEVFSQPPGSSPARTPKAADELRKDRVLVELLRTAVESVSDETGWANLGAVGSAITKQDPAFDSRKYGFGKLSDLIAATALFTVERRDLGVWIRDPAPRA